MGRAAALPAVQWEHALHPTVPGSGLQVQHRRPSLCLPFSCCQGVSACARRAGCLLPTPRVPADQNDGLWDASDEPLTNPPINGSNYGSDFVPLAAPGCKVVSVKMRSPADIDANKGTAPRGRAADACACNTPCCRD